MSSRSTPPQTASNMCPTTLRDRSSSFFGVQYARMTATLVGESLHHASGSPKRLQRTSGKSDNNHRKSNNQYGTSSNKQSKPHNMVRKQQTRASHGTERPPFMILWCTIRTNDSNVGWGVAASSLRVGKASAKNTLKNKVIIIRNLKTNMGYLMNT